MLDADAIRERCVVCREISRDRTDAGIRQIKTRAPAGQRGRGARAIEDAHGIGGDVMYAIAGALVGVGDGAAFLQAPFAGGGDRTVYAT